MRKHLLSLLAGCFCVSQLAQGAPPAPSFTIYGKVRDDHGNPVGTSIGTVILSRPTGEELLRTPSDATLGVGINYTLHVAMDAGTTTTLYKPTAMFTGQPFAIHVAINGVTYSPIEMATANWVAGLPGGMVRIDLTLGNSSGNDGLPDAWKQDVINSDTTGRLRTLADVRPNDDLDGDGFTNLQEMIAGTNPLDRSDSPSLSIVSVANGIAHLQFLAIRGRTYTITSSTDLATWTPQPFSTDPSGANPVSARIEPDGQLLDVFVPAGSSVAFFKLYVE